MKKVLFINSNLAWGGGEKWHLEMARALAKENYQTSLLVQPQSELAMKARECHLKTIELKQSNLSPINPFTRKKLKQILKKINPAAIILNLPRDVKFCAPIAKKMGIQVIYRRGMPNTLKRNFINEYVYPYVDIFIANSMEIKKSLTTNFPELESKVKIIYNGVTPLPKIPQKESSSIFRIGNLGRLVSQKGHDHLIKIAHELKEKSFPFHLYIAGKGPLEQKILADIRKYKLEKEVTLLGHTTAENFFKQIDLMVFTSEFEGSANALIESLLYQTPAIAFDISSMPEVIEHGKEGYLISPFDIKEFAHLIQQIAGNKELYKEFQTNALFKIKRHFLYEEKVKEVGALIR